MKLAGEAVNGREAITLAERLQPDVILMDLHMLPITRSHLTVSQDQLAKFRSPD